MDEDKKSGQPASEDPAAEVTTKRHGRSRRAFVKKLALGSAVAVGISQALPKKWTKPVVDSIVLPVHAQATGGTITAFWIIGDDAPGGADVGIGVGTTDADGFLYDDGTDMSFYGTLDPPADVAVHISVNQDGTTYGGDPGVADFGATDTDADPTTGDFNFGTFSPPNGDFGDNPGTGDITVTFSAPGYANSVIHLSLS